MIHFFFFTKLRLKKAYSDCYEEDERALNLSFMGVCRSHRGCHGHSPSSSRVFIGGKSSRFFSLSIVLSMSASANDTSNFLIAEAQLVLDEVCSQPSTPILG